MVITLNADWGDGKTTFIKLWEEELAKDSSFIPVYYNAFENDFANDVFISITIAIQKSLEE